MSPTANKAWLDTISEVLRLGEPVSGQFSTGANKKSSYEVLCHTLAFNMQYPVVDIRPNTSFLYMAAEAMWVLDGSNSLLAYPEIERIQAPYSDNGEILRGAYGPPFKQQQGYIIDKLSQDINTRQAVMTIWKRNPTPSKDVPCTVAMQFLIRNDKIHTIVTMRSSDVGMGLPYDMFTFTCMTAEITSKLPFHVELGNCYITAGSRHIYIDQVDNLGKLLDYADLRELPQPLEMWKWPRYKEKLQLCANIPIYSKNDRMTQQFEAKEILLNASSY